MSEEFDPEWEYRVEDPEVLEAVLLNGRPREKGLGLILEFTGTGNGKKQLDGQRTGTRVYDIDRPYLPNEEPEPVKLRKCALRSCQKEFLPTERGGRVKKFCSRGCAAVECANKRREEVKRNRARVRCHACLKWFRLPPSWARRGRRHYCSRRCFAFGRSRDFQEVLKCRAIREGRTPAYSVGRVPEPCGMCAVCGGQCFTTLNRQYRKFCGIECSTKYHQERRKARVRTGQGV